MYRIVVCTIFLSAASGQTMVDLRTQSKSVDFSSANSTKPFKSGVSLPAACSVGEMFYLTNALSGANVYGCTSPNAWTLESQSGGSTLPSVAGNAGKVLSTDGTNLLWTAAGGSSGPFLLSQAQDLAVVQSDSTDLSIGANCSPATPCNVRFGSVAFSFMSSATATVSSGTGLAYGYIASNGALTIGSNLTVSCSSNCNIQPGVAAFPPNAIPLFTWSATNGAWDSGGLTDVRAFLSSKVIVPGTGLVSADSGGTTTLSADASLLSLRTAPPSASSAACVTGAWALDSSYFYICVATNTWRRATTSSW